MVKGLVLIESVCNFDDDLWTLQVLFHVLAEEDEVENVKDKNKARLD